MLTELFAIKEELVLSSGVTAGGVYLYTRLTVKHLKETFLQSNIHLTEKVDRSFRSIKNLKEELQSSKTTEINLSHELIEKLSEIKVEFADMNARLKMIERELKIRNNH